MKQERRPVEEQRGLAVEDEGRREEMRREEKRREEPSS
jgi:hypothetical protein